PMARRLRGAPGRASRLRPDRDASGIDRGLSGEDTDRRAVGIGGVRARRSFRARGAARGPDLLLRGGPGPQRHGERVREAREPVGRGAPGRERRVLPGEDARDLGPLPRLRGSRGPEAAGGGDGVERTALTVLRTRLAARALAPGLATRPGSADGAISDR